MRKKSYFMFIYNVMQGLGTGFIASLIFLLLFQTIQEYTKNEPSSLPLFQLLPTLVEKIVTLLQIVSLAAPVLLLVLLVPEIIHRIKKDSITNLGKSILGTFRFRRFLKQSYKHTKPLSQLEKEPEPESIVVTRFNQAVKKSVFELTHQQLKLFIKIPKEAQAQKILKEHEEPIKEHIASFYPDYIISTFERKKYSLWLIGTKQR